MKITDTHCHLNFNIFENDLEATLERARAKNVDRIIIPGTDLETSEKAIFLSEKYPALFAAVGIHPNDALKWENDTYEILHQYASHPKVVGIGEIGLDYYHDHAPHDIQKFVFLEQLRLAADLELPVIIHSRQSFEDVWNILEDWVDKLVKAGNNLLTRPGILHSFEGSIENALIVISKKFYIGIGGPVTYNNAIDQQKLVTEIPIEYLVLETDSPFLTPHPYRGRRNEPANILIIAEKIAQLKNLNISEVLQITESSTAALFGWRAE